MKKLIVAADDFGLTKSVNQGIVRAHREGIVTSLNLLPSGEAYDDAIDLAAKNALGEAGAHLALTETIPVSDISSIRSLIGSDGRFRKGHTDFFLSFIFGKIDPDEIYIEWKSQLVKAISSGIRITNLSSHEHIHMLPRLLDVLIKLAKEYDIPAIRFPHSDRLSGNLNARVAIKALMLRAFENKIETQLRMSHIISPQHFRGFFDSGNITEEVLLDIISNLENGDTELVCHPGYLGKEVIDHYTFHKNCEAELFALTSPRVKRLLEEKQVTLTSYSDFLSSNHIAVLPYMVRSTK